MGRGYGYRSMDGFCLLEQAQRQLQQLDERRKEDFKRQEMWLEHRRRQKLSEMNEQQRLKSEAEFERKQAELRKHEPVPHPASKEQLETVWEEDDGMAKNDFDPKTFFHLHGEWVWFIELMGVVIFYILQIEMETRCWMLWRWRHCFTTRYSGPGVV